MGKQGDTGSSPHAELTTDMIAQTKQQIREMVRHMNNLNQDDLNQFVQTAGIDIALKRVGAELNATLDFDVMVRQLKCETSLDQIMALEACYRRLVTINIPS
jgi:hypothetical protein